MSNDDFERLEKKVDDLTSAINRLVLFEERQSIQSVAIAALNTHQAASDARSLAIERKLDSWINRGVGVWGVVAVALTLLKLYPGHA
jgi:hypothetical protein